MSTRATAVKLYISRVNLKTGLDDEIEVDVEGTVHSDGEVEIDSVSALDGELVELTVMEGETAAEMLAIQAMDDADSIDESDLDTGVFDLRELGFES